MGVVCNFFTSRLIKIMKISFILMMLAVLQVSATNLYSQKAQISLNLNNSSLIKVFNEIQQQSEFDLFYRHEQIPLDKKVSINCEKENINNILNNVLKDTKLGYVIIDRDIVISSNNAKKSNNSKKIVKGKVTDSSGEALPGVAVLEMGTENGTVTNADGTYSITVEGEDVRLRFSFIGMDTKEISVGSQKVVDVSLVSSLSGLDEVVVVGYGLQKKVNVSGAVSTVSPKQLAKRPVSSTSKALQGVAPGLVIVDRGGMAGSESTIMQIRGITSLSGSSSPLIYVDGIEQSMNDIDPSEIESISVLKDAASTAIYGSRGANGVILITTKRGTQKGLNVQYSGYYAIQEVSKLPEKVGIRDYMMLYNEAFRNDGQPEPFTQQDIDNTANGTDPYRWPNTDWHDVIFDPAPQHNHAITMNGGSEKIKFNLAMNYLQKDGVLVANNDFERYGARLNTDITFSKKLKGQLNINVRRKDWTEPRNAGTVFWRLFHDMPPWGLPKLEDGRYGTSIPGNNQLARIESGKRTRVEDYVLANAKLEYELIDGLKVIGEYSHKTTNKTDRKHQKTVKLYNWDGSYAKDLASENSIEYGYQKYQEIQLRGLLQYEKSIKDNNIKALLGAERVDKNYQSVWAKRNKAYNDILDVINAGDSETDSNSGYEDNLKIGSYFGRFNYDYMGKYMFEANFRYDGSSRFDEGSTRWGFFPSYSAAWRISEEDFAKDYEWMDNLKLRASYGATGKQDNISYWQYISYIDIKNVYAFGTTDKAVQGAWQRNLANRDITWETTKILDIGLEGEFLGGKFGFVFDYYKKRTEDILNNRIPIPKTVGFPNPAVNAGTIENRGWELSLTHRNKINDDLSYSVVFNISDNTNEVIDLVGTGPYVSGWTVAKVGKPLWALWGYQTNGFYRDQADLDASPLFDTNTIPGDIKYVDRNNDGKINGDDKMYLGDASPHFPVSMNLNVEYKNFDFSMFWQGVLKQKAYMEGALTEGPNYGNFTHKDMLGRWTPETAETATWPVLRKNSWKSQMPSDFWIRDAGYFRLKNIQLGYTLPKEITQKAKIEKVRFYISGDNLFTFSQEKLIDPEFKPGRVNYHPQLKLYMVGVNVNF